MKLRLAAACLAVPLLLSGCLIPEKFQAKVRFADDGSYVFSYAGSVVSAVAAMQIAKAGKLNAKEEAALQLDGEKLKNNPDVRSVAYKGNARFDLSMDGSHPKGEAYSALKILSVKTDKDGVTTVSSAAVTPRDQKGLDELRIKMDGVLEVRLPSNAKVLTHNASTTPGMLGGAYAWKIGDVKQRPSISFRLQP